MKRFLWLLSLWMTLFVSCDHLPASHGSQAENTVDSFCQAYFRYHFERALQFTTDESRPWLVYAASNVNQDDIDALRAMENSPSIDVDEVVAPENDSTGYAVVEVSDYLVMDTIGQAAHLQASSQYRFDMVKRGGKWKIKLSGLPRGRNI